MTDTLPKNRRTPQESADYVLSQVESWVDYGLQPLSAITVVSRQHGLDRKKLINLYLRVTYGVE